MEMTTDVRDRIFRSADALYEEAGRAAFPTVDAVRKHAKVNMNDASTGMKVWRRSQSAQVETVVVQVPDRIQQTSSAALSALWSEAVTLANESLRAAQVGWDVERAELSTLSEQLANAFESLAADLEAAHVENTRLVLSAARASDALTSIQKVLDEKVCAMEAALVDAKRADIRSAEIERRASELRQELDRAHATAGEIRKEAAAARHSHELAISYMQGELARQQEKAESEGRSAQAALSEAREENALLRGRLDANEKPHPARGARTTAKGNGKSTN
ncbi:MAG: DNA-binding protein [Pseudomonadota bacterium]